MQKLIDNYKKIWAWIGKNVPAIFRFIPYLVLILVAVVLVIIVAFFAGRTSLRSVYASRDAKDAGRIASDDSAIEVADSAKRSVVAEVDRLETTGDDLERESRKSISITN